MRLTKAREEYNALGKVIRETDPVGRTTIYSYAPDGIDLLERRQVNGQNTELLASYTYNDKHEPLRATDASGQTTTYTYLPDGRLETIVTPPHAGLSAAERTTTYAYYPDNAPTGAGQLQSVTGPSTALGSPTTSYTYDAYGRVRTLTDADNYTITFDYDALDRLTRVTYPDGTYEETTYNRLDAEGQRDRLGRWTRTFHDALRRPVAVRDAAGRTTQKADWVACSSGCAGSSLARLTDSNGHATAWDYDLQGRVVKETRTDNSQYVYTYETTSSRLKSVRDPKEDVKTNTYNLDGSLAGISYTVTAGTAATPSVSFSYDPVYDRLAAITDGTGTTAYTYYPVANPPALGAGLVRTVDGPLADDTIEYFYDELGRVASRQIGSSANTQTQAFDVLGRLSTLINPLGTFTFGYDGVTRRLTSLAYPSGQETTWAYYDNAGGRRLREIHNKRPGGATLSRFEYTYDKVGNVLTWLQQADSGMPKVYELSYDSADQLTAAIFKTADPTPQILKRYYYAYDLAANRVAEQIDDAVTGATYNSLNQLVSQQAGGALVFKGTVSEPGSVTIAGKPATVTADDRFEGQAVVPASTGQVAVAATDASGNVRTNTYQISQAASGKSFTYDLNGNMTSDGTRTYEWDGENRLVAVKEGTTTVASFTYNSSGLRASRAAAGVTTTFMLEGANVLEERLSTGEVRKHFQGPDTDTVLAAQSSTTGLAYFTRDHLGSVREQVDSGGTLLLRRDYDAWGDPLAGSSTGGWSFTGRESDPELSLLYYRARYYDPRIGRFISEDPIALRGGPNTYAYIEASPVNGIDPSGTTCRQNAEFFVQWVTGTYPCNVKYHSSSTRSKEMTGSPGADMLRRAFKAANCQPIQKDFSTGEAARKTLPHPCSTAAQVGGFMGWASPEGKCDARYKIVNKAGTYSFFYHKAPDRSSCEGPGHTVTQEFEWVEPSPCAGKECNCK